MHQRQLRVRILRWLEHCHVTGSDPLECSADRWSAYVDGKGWDAARRAKEASAVRLFLAAEGVLSNEHGLGTGAQSSRLPPLGSRDRACIESFLESSYPGRRDPARSALCKLAVWCDEMAIPLLSFDELDIDDFGYWLRGVGGTREVMVVARKWARHVTVIGRSPDDHFRTPAGSP